MTWWERAACKNERQEVFFPSFDKALDREKRKHLYDAAKAFCGRCPVTRECLEAAMREEKSYAPHGVRGGLSPDERLDLYRGMSA